MKEWISIITNRVFLRYCGVGVLGTLIDVGVLALLLWMFGVDPKTSSLLYLFTTIAFTSAVVNNFILNKIWTFELKTKKHTARQFIKFIFTSLIGLAITNALMGFMVMMLGVWVIAAKLITSAVVLVWNFFANKFWTFKTRSLVRKSGPALRFDTDLSVIIPAYNEANRLPQTLRVVYSYVLSMGLSFEIIVVDDGSSDDTSEVVRSFQIAKNNFHTVRLVQSKRNFGKGSAVSIGMMMAKGEYMLFIDADNSTPIEELEGFYAQRHRADVLIGSRYLVGSNVLIKQPWYRIMIGRVANLFIQLFLVDGIKDTQCGFKMFRHSVAKDIFSRMKVEGFGFDMEALALAELLGYSIRELPVDWQNSAESRVRAIRDTFKTLLDLIYIKLNIWTGKYKKKGERYAHEEVEAEREVIRHRVLLSAGLLRTPTTSF